MNTLRKTLAIGAVLALGLLSGCATIVGDEKQTLPITSSPAGAQILIVDEAGRTAYRGHTPDKVPLAKSSGRFWGGKQFTVTISKRGYFPQQLKVDTHPNTLYLGGNLVFGGLIGWLIVDPTSGKMYELSRDGIAVTLQKRATGADTDFDEDQALTAPRPPAAAPAPGGAPATEPATAPPPATAPAVAPPAPATAPATLPAPAGPAPTAAPEPSAGGAPTIAPLPSAVPPTAPAVQEAAPPAPAEAPPTPPAATPPRQYWPIPPALPVSPSTAVPQATRTA